MNVFSGLKPGLIWKYFNEVTKIPRPSGQEDRITSYLISFAHDKNLLWKKDKTGNIVIKKPSQPGYENRQTCILQSHVDMVCEKNSDTEFNFSTDPITTYIEDGWVKARGTTLGADNGIGVAAQLAILSDSTLKHGRLECIFTVEEETGLTGAKRIHPRLMTGTKLINLDSEEDGELCIGCAGGIDTVINIPYQLLPTPGDNMAVKILVSGLSGGHSGTDINLGRANAIKVLCELLHPITKHYNIFISDIKGGNLRNAIPREAFAVIVFPSPAEKDVMTELTKCIQQQSNTLQAREPNITITTSKVESPLETIHPEIWTKTLHALLNCPNGVIEMSTDMPDLVQTSTNLASIVVKPKHIEIVTSQRSSVDDSKMNIANEITNLFTSISAHVEHSDPYPGWQPDTNSELLKITRDAHEELFGKIPVVKAIHAGLECGLFLKRYPHLDMISFGPTILDAHSPYERLEIETVERFWKLLVTVLSQIPER